MQADSFSRKGAGPMKERLQQLLSEAGESFDYLKSDIRNLSRYMAELEELIESYRAFAATATLSAPADRATQRKLLKGVGRWSASSGLGREMALEILPLRIRKTAGITGTHPSSLSQCSSPAIYKTWSYSPG
jgi:hypothetical protein